MPRAVAGPTSRLPAAVPPVAVAEVSTRVIPVGALASTPVVTMPSASEALSAACPAVPKNTLRFAGQLATTGWFTGAPHAWSVAAPLRGVGAALAKSAELLSLSVQPFAARRAAVVLERPGAGAPSEDLAVPP